MTRRTLLELAAFFAVLLADAHGFVPLTLTAGLLPVVMLLLWRASEPWAVVGFSLPPRLLQAVALGIVLGLAMELLAIHVTTPLIGGLLGTSPDYSDLAFVRGSLKYLFIMLGLNWVLAAFGEELCFRGFLMHRLSRLFGGTTWAWIIGLVLTSVIFGSLHSEQGLAGALQEGLSGLLLGLMFLLTKRNLTVPIVAHGVSNTLAFVLIYLGRYPGA
jgi:uncharacterized protein